MEGLHSIALAVAHLESLQQQDHEDIGNGNVMVDTLPITANISTLDVTSKSPCRMPKGTRFSSTTRIITLDESSDQVNVGNPSPLSECSTDVSDLHEQVQPPSHDSDFNGGETQGKSTTAISDPIKNLQDFFTIDPELAAAAASSCPPAPSPGEVIPSILHDDVLCGRGGETNHHPGNVQYRQLVKWCQPAYLEAKRRDKPRIAAGIVTAVRRIGGRFLKRDGDTNTWRDVGNRRAREKTSQALREGAPELRNGPQPPDLLDTANDHASYKNNMKGSMININNKVSDDSSGSAEMMSSTNQLLLSSIPKEIAASSLSGPNVADEHLSKKMRRSNASFDGYIQIPVVSPVPHMMVIMSSQQKQQQQQAVSPKASVVATISGDDDDEDVKAEGPCIQGRHGPRIKLLKRRLEYETN